MSVNNSIQFRYMNLRYALARESKSRSKSIQVEGTILAEALFRGKEEKGREGERNRHAVSLVLI